MSHSVRDKQKLLHRVRRIRGQLDAIERALDAEAGCEEIIQQLTSCRGAMSGLVGVVVEEHIRTHFAPMKGKGALAGDPTEGLIRLVHSYFR
jgi:DNA-binding FrmR family transcriptional regulator